MSISLKRTLGRGIALAIPLAVVVYVFIRIIGIFEKMIAPAATKMGIEKIWGQLTLTVFAILLVILIIFFLGLLMRLAVVSAVSKNLEGMVLKFVPSLNELKVMAADKLDLETNQNSWKPVVLFYENKYNAAFIIEQSDELITLFVSKTTSLKEGEILIANKKDVSVTPVNYNDLKKCNKAFGKGYIALIQSNKTIQ